MPYQRRYVRRTRSYRKRAYGFKKARTAYRPRSVVPMKMYKQPASDPGYLARVKWEVYFVNQGAGGCYTQFNWLATGASSNTDVYFTGGTAAGGNSKNPSFGQCQVMFKEYMIKGMKIQYKPYHQIGQRFTVMTNGNQAASDPIFHGAIRCGTVMDSDIQAGGVLAQTYTNSRDFREYDHDKPFKRYYKVSKFSKAQNVPMRLTDTAGNNLQPGGYNVAPNCITSMSMDVAGLPIGTILGQLLVTYYVWFKNRKTASIRF